MRADAQLEGWIATDVEGLLVYGPPGADVLECGFTFLLMRRCGAVVAASAFSHWLLLLLLLLLPPPLLLLQLVLPSQPCCCCCGGGGGVLALCCCPWPCAASTTTTTEGVDFVPYAQQLLGYDLERRVYDLIRQLKCQSWWEAYYQIQVSPARGMIPSVSVSLTSTEAGICGVMAAVQQTVLECV
jgi:hypothetical protein